ncbi:MAG: hypothetical protein GY772_06940 [bacterium]|nr:hypothetical protein [bacterium]
MKKKKKKKPGRRSGIAVAMRRRFPRKMVMRDRRMRRSGDAGRSWRAEVDW